jgi:hypothetical protein
MSHFVVLVIGENVEDKLEPYWELDLPEAACKTDSRAVFEVKVEDTPEAIHGYLMEDRERWVTSRNDAMSILSNPETQASEYLTQKFRKLDTLQDAIRLVTSEQESWVKLCHDNIVKADAALADPLLVPAHMRASDGYCYVPGKGYGYYHNPKASWDWFVIGGRWMGTLLMKDGCTGRMGMPSWCNENETPAGVDSANVEDIDWDRMDATERDFASKRWDHATESLSRENFQRLYGAFSDKEDYLRKEGVFSTYAVITDDGEWHSPGTMGWWGTHSDSTEEHAEFSQSFRERFINNLPDGTKITVVDCHI